jgi:predicted Fe-S protein YdhL (DUF1289 family)
MGCFRHLDEILEWGTASEQRKAEILAQTIARRAGRHATEQ